MVNPVDGKCQCKDSDNAVMDQSTGLCSCKDSTNAGFVNSICECTDSKAYLDPSGTCKCIDIHATLSSSTCSCPANSAFGDSGSSPYCVCADYSYMTAGSGSSSCVCIDDHATFDNGACKCSDPNAEIQTSGDRKGYCGCKDANGRAVVHESDGKCYCIDSVNA